MTSLTTMNVHNVQSIETRIERGSVESGMYCARVIKITAEDGSRFELTLFADDSGALAIGDITEGGAA